MLSIFFTLKTSPDLAPGSYTLTGSLRVQACDDNSCLPPSTLDISIPVEVVASNTAFQSTNQDLFSEYTGKSIESSSSASLTDNSIASMFNERGAILSLPRHISDWAGAKPDALRLSHAFGNGIAVWRAG
ncbi:MAG: hypothetical protein U5K69_28415 [Balneolaceae bacterium]|nr:hypothetical protein [Balneolaceae bacterium]